MSDVLSGTAQFKYKAFLSYSHRDKTWGNWLQKGLENYRVPKRLVATQGLYGAVPPKLFPIFRDREELPASAELSERIRTGLEQAPSLIVICSPNSASSRWVNEEILAFKRLGRENRILALIVDGEPNADDEPSLEDL
jgi:eukaryotic-like serine/threonine-protein kinase